MPQDHFDGDAHVVQRSLGEETLDCNSGQYQCPLEFREICYPEWGRGTHGVCQCNRFLGLYGPNCSHLSVASYVLIAIMSSTAVVGIWSMGVNIRFLGEVGAKRGLFTDSIGRTAVFNAAVLLTLVAQSAGLLLSTVLKDVTYWERIREPSSAVFFVALVAATSSISSVWLEMADKTAAASI